MKKIFSIGELSEILKIPTSKLRYYDKKRLFSPNIRKENGYRYYSLDQLVTVDKIIVMRSLGFSIEDIRDFLNDNSYPVLSDKIKKDKQIIESVLKKIEEEKARLDIIEKDLRKYLEQTSGAVKLEVNVPFIEEFPEMRGMNYGDYTSLAPVKSIFKILNEYKENTTLHTVKKEIGDFDKKNIFGFRYITLRDESQNSEVISKAGKYACIMIQGKTVKSSSIKKFLDWIRENGFEPADDYFYVETRIEVLGIKKINDTVHRLRILIK